MIIFEFEAIDCALDVVNLNRTYQMITITNDAQHFELCEQNSDVIARLFVIKKFSYNTNGKTKPKYD